MQPGNYAFLDTYDDGDDLDDLIEEFDLGADVDIPKTNASEFKALSTQANSLLKEANNIHDAKHSNPQPMFNIALDDDEIDEGARALISRIQDEIALEKKLGIKMES